MVLLQKVVHKKYTYKNGHKYGPYFYSTQRKGDRVVTNYLGKDVVIMKKPEWRFMVTITGVIFAFLVFLLFLSYNSHLTGRVSLDIDSEYRPGEVVGGQLRLGLTPGELIPADSMVTATLGDATQTFSLSQILSNQTYSGMFYLEDQNINGDGLGFGVPGTARVYPNVTFELVVSSEVPTEPVVEPETSVDSVPQTETPTDETPTDTVTDAGSETPSETPVSEETPTESSGVSAETPSDSGSDEPTSDASVDSSSDESSSDAESSSDSSSESGSGSDSGDSGVTGAAVSEDRFTVEGRVSRGEDFSYHLESGQTAWIVPGSVKFDGESVPDGVLELDTSSNLVVVSTSYSVEQQGFGPDYISGEPVMFSINLAGFGLVALNDTNLSLMVQYEGSELVHASRNIAISGQTPVLSVVNDTAVVTNDTFGSEVTLVQEGARLGQPVTWTKTVTLDSAAQLVVELPEDAENAKIISVTSGENSDTAFRVNSDGNLQQIGTDVVAEAVASDTTASGAVVADLTPARDAPLTGNAIDDPTDEVSSSSNLVVVDDSVTEAVIQYETPAPYSLESDNARGKEILVVGPENVHYANVVAFTQLSESFGVKDTGVVKVFWKEENTYLGVTLADNDGNGIYDYAEWLVPHLSNQTFIIEITSAQHLNSAREFVSDIYPEVFAQDGNWSETINNGEYVRVTFEQNLTSVNDITVYPRTVEGTPTIDVYEADGSEVLATFDPLVDDEYNRVLLTSLGDRSQNTFDLHVLNGGAQFDHIIDPFTDNGSSTQFVSDCGPLSTAGATYTLNQSITPTLGGSCFTVTAANSVVDCAGFSIINTTASGQSGFELAASNVTIRNCRIMFANTGADMGIFLQDVGYDHISIINTTVSSAEYCVDFSIGADDIYIANSTFYDCYDTADVVGVGVALGGMRPRVENVAVNTSGYGFLLVGARLGTFSRINVTAVTSSQSSAIVGVGAGTAIGFASSSHFNNFTDVISNSNTHGIRWAATAAGSNNTLSGFIINNSAGNAVHFLGVATRGNVIQNFTILNTPGNFNDVFFGTNSINGTVLANTNFGNLTFSAGVGSLVTFRNTSAGEIAYVRPINGTSINGTSSIIIRSNFVFINETVGLRGLNKTANITLYNMPGTYTTPAIYRNGAACPAGVCTNFTSLNAANVMFNVSGGGNYTIVETAAADTVSPLVSLVYPTNTTYASVITSINYTASDTNLQACWYSTNNGVSNTTVTCGTNVTGLTAAQGSNTWLVAANDSAGNRNLSRVTFSVDSVAPGVTINAPANITYLYPSNYPLVFNVTLSEPGNTVYYSLDNGSTNVTMTSVDGLHYNASLVSQASGGYAFRVFANDLAGNLNSTTQVFYSVVGTQVSSCAVLSNANTVYTVANDLDSSGICITISASNVTLDVAGRTISCSECSSDKFGLTTGTAVHVSSSNVTIKNAVITDETEGIKVESASGLNILNNSISATSEALYLEFVDGSVISNNTLMPQSSARGIYLVGSYNLFSNNRVQGTIDGTSGEGMRIDTSASSGNVLVNNSFSRGTYGLLLYVGPSNTTVRGGLISNYATTSLLITSSSNNSFSDLVIDSSTTTGISLALDSYNNNFTGVNLTGSSASARELSVSAGTNGTYFANSIIGNYTLAGVGSLVTVEKFGAGKVVFLAPVSSDAANFSNDIRIVNNGVFVNETVSSAGLNKPANITLYNMPGNFIDPAVFRNGAICGVGCYNFTSLNAATVIFNVSSAGNYTIMSDATAPFVSIVYPIATTYGSVITALNYTVQDTNLQSCWYSTSNGVTNTTVTCGTNVTGLTVAQGTNTWRVYANDSAGNANMSSVTFTIDSVAPLIDYVSPTETDGSVVGRLNILINVTATDTNLSNISIMLYDSSRALLRSDVTTDSPNFVNLSDYIVSDGEFGFTSVALTDGLYYFNASTRDIYNNANFTATRNVTLDATAPVVTYGARTAADGATLSGNSIYVNVSVTELHMTGGSVTFSLYNSTSLVNQTIGASTARALNWTGLTGGTYIYSVSVADAVNNIGSSGNRTITLDSGAPAVTLVYPTNTTYASVITSINYTASDTNLQACWYSTNNGVSNTTVTCGTNVTGLTAAQGSNTWLVAANDSLGNQNLSRVTFAVDSIAPTIGFVTPSDSDGAIVSRQFIIVNVSASDSNFANITVRLFNSTTLLNTTVRSTSAAYLNFSVSADGIYFVNATALDTALNANTTSTKNVTVDTTFPQISFNEGNEPNNEFGSSLNVNVTVVEPSLANITYYVMNASGIVNSSVFTSSTTNVSFALAPGTYNYTVNVTDIANNRNTTGRRSFTILSSCLDSVCAEGADCTIARACYLNSGSCTGGICDFGNLSILNTGAVYALYNGSNDGNSLVINISGNLSWLSGGKIIFSGKNGTAQGGNGGTVNITLPGLFLRRNATFIGMGGYSTDASTSGGRGGIVQITYHGLIGTNYNSTGSNFTGGRSVGALNGTAGSISFVKDQVCPLDADINNDGLVGSLDIVAVDEKYNTLAGDAEFISTYDINCDSKTNVIDLSKVGLTYLRA